MRMQPRLKSNIRIFGLEFLLFLVMSQFRLINLNEPASIQDNMEQQQQQPPPENHDNGLDSEAMNVNSNHNNDTLMIEDVSLQKQDHVAVERPRRKREQSSPKKTEREPWTEEEHRLFLNGLNKHRKGKWKEISEEFVTTKTPSQIASHAQKYYKRQDAKENKRKKRRSIHDTRIDNNGTLVTIPIEIQDEVPSSERQKEIPPSNNTPRIEIKQGFEVPLVEQQNNISRTVTHPSEEQNEIPPQDTNNDNLSIPPIEPNQERKTTNPQFVFTLRTCNVLPHDIEKVTKLCDLLEENLKR